MRVQERIQKLEKEIVKLWQVVEDEMLWHPSVVREIKRRSLAARRDHVKGRLRRAEEVLA